MNIYSILEKTIDLIENNLDNQELNVSFLSNKVFDSPYELAAEFKKLLISYYEDYDNESIKKFLKDNCWRKINLKKPVLFDKNVAN